MAPTIDYTSIDFDTLTQDLIDYLKQTDTFKDVDFTGSNIRTLVESIAYVGTLNSFYVNAAANEMFLPTAKLYKNLNKLSSLLNYLPRGKKAATLDLVLNLDTDYAFGREGRYFTIPSYSEFTSSKLTSAGEAIQFVNEQDIVYKIMAFGVETITSSVLLYDGTPWSSFSSSGTLTLDKFSLDTSARFPFVKLADDLSIEQTIREALDSESVGNVTKDTDYSLQFLAGTPASLRVVLATGATPAEEILKFRHSSVTDTLEIIQNNSEGHFYVGYLGVKNLDQTTLVLYPTAGRITRLELTFDEDADPFKVLVDGDIYSWASGQTSITTPDYENGHFADVTTDLNLILKVSGKPTSNFTSELVVTDADPGAGEAVIATISKDLIDSSGNLLETGFDVTWQNVGESFKIANLKQGSPKQTLILESGEVSNDVDDLQVTYNSATKKYSVGLDDISYEDFRVFVLEGSQVTEWTYKTTSTDTDDTSKVFYSRYNSNSKNELWFGQDDFGADPTGNRIVLIGLETVGLQGNVQSNTIDDTVTVTNFSGNLFKSQEYLQAGIISSTVISDDLGDTVTFAVKQGYAATGGADPETTEELRKNIPRATRSQSTVVSEDDYRDFLLQQYGDILVDVKAVNYTDAQEGGFISSTELEKYFFNTIFIVVVPMTGLTLLQYQKDLILSDLRDKYKAMITPSHVIWDATLVPIDVAVNYRKSTSIVRPSVSIESEIKNAIETFFTRTSRSIGETIVQSDVLQLCLAVDGVTSSEVMLVTDQSQKYGQADYDVDITTQDYSSDSQLQGLKRRLLLELEQKGLLKKYQPLFDVETIVDQLSLTTKRSWTQSNDITLEANEFPILGDVIIEERT